MFRNYLLILFLLFGNTSIYGQYDTPLPFLSWKGKLKKQIKKKPLQTIEGIAITPGGEDLSPFYVSETATGDELNLREHGGGLYTFKLEVHYKDNIRLACDDKSYNHSETKMLSLFTTRLIAVIRKDNCISVTGAYDKSGNFICRKIYNKATDSYIVNW